LNESWDFDEHGSLLLALALANNIAFIQSYLGNLQEVNGSISWFEGMRAFSDQHSLLEFEEYMFFFSTGICFGGQPLALPAAA
jgi:hypothetical protein